jgi:hypothetical protein
MRAFFPIDCPICLRSLNIAVKWVRFFHVENCRNVIRNEISILIEILKRHKRMIELFNILKPKN